MLTSSYPKFPGDGTAPFIEHIAIELARRGHDVDVVLPSHPELSIADRAPGLPLRLFPFFAGSSGAWGYAASMHADRRLRRASLALAPLVFVTALHRLRALVARERYDIVHAHWLLPNGPIAALAAGAQLPLVVSLHGSDVFVAERSRVLSRAARWVMARSAWTLACSHDLARRARRLGGEHEVEVLPYGVDIPSLDVADVARWREQLGATPDVLLVVAVGRLVAKKGFSTLVRAASILRREGISIRVAIGGAGDLAAPIAAEARTLGCEADVTLLGRVAHERVASLLAGADVVAVPSMRDEEGNVDGLPNVLLEALAVGRPIVASRVGGIPDVLADGVDSVLVEPGDAKALAGALLRLRDEPELRARLAQQAQRRAAGLPWSAYAETLAAGYRRISRRGSGASGWPEEPQERGDDSVPQKEQQTKR
jgi:glycosyltransferase involved in cell wall biosynthesis